MGILLFLKILFCKFARNKFVVFNFASLRFAKIMTLKAGNNPPTKRVRKNTRKIRAKNC
jgi:hypothetical protein